MTYSLQEWPRIDAGGVSDAALFDIIDGRPPEPRVLQPLFYPILDPDAPENKVGMSPFTLLWYSSLPTFMKSADQAQNPETGAWPMLRYMDAVGHIADGVRSTVNDMYSGVWTDPARVPDRAVKWLASVLGVPASQKNVPLAQLREALANMVANGKSPVGTRAELASAAKQFLTGTKVVSVRSAAEVPNFLTPTDQNLVTAVGLADVRALSVSPEPPEVVVRNVWTGTVHASVSHQLRYGTLVAENLVHNPAFAVDLFDWSVNVNVTQARDTTVKETGAASAKLTPTAADWYWLENYRTTPTAGEHVLRMRVRVDTARNVQLRVWQYDGGVTVTSPVIGLTAGVWQWIELPFTITNTLHRYRVSLMGPALDASLVPVFVDRVYTARKTHAVLTYFDGASPDSAAEDIWVDTDTRKAQLWDSASNAWVTHVGSETQAGAVVDERANGDMIRAHSIVITVRSDQVPGGDLVAFANNLRRVGVVPAAHSLTIVTAQPTWENYQAKMDALGGTWTAYEDNTKVWTDVEALGLSDFGA